MADELDPTVYSGTFCDCKQQSYSISRRSKAHGLLAPLTRQESLELPAAVVHASVLPSLAGKPLDYEHRNITVGNIVGAGLTPDGQANIEFRLNCTPFGRQVKASINEGKLLGLSLTTHEEVLAEDFGLRVVPIDVALCTEGAREGTFIKHRVDPDGTTWHTIHASTAAAGDGQNVQSIKGAERDDSQTPFPVSFVIRIVKASNMSAPAPTVAAPAPVAENKEAKEAKEVKAPAAAPAAPPPPAAVAATAAPAPSPALVPAATPAPVPAPFSSASLSSFNAPTAPATSMAPPPPAMPFMWPQYSPYQMFMPPPPPPAPSMSSSSASVPQAPAVSEERMKAMEASIKTLLEEVRKRPQEESVPLPRPSAFVESAPPRDVVVPASADAWRRDDGGSSLVKLAKPRSIVACLRNRHPEIGHEFMVAAQKFQRENGVTIAEDGVSYYPPCPRNVEASAWPGERESILYDAHVSESAGLNYSTLMRIDADAKSSREQVSSAAFLVI